MHGFFIHAFNLTRYCIDGKALEIYLSIYYCSGIMRRIYNRQKIRTKFSFLSVD